MIAEKRDQKSSREPSPKDAQKGGQGALSGARIRPSSLIREAIQAPPGRTDGAAVRRMTELRRRLKACGIRPAGDCRFGGTISDEARSPAKRIYDNAPLRNAARVIVEQSRPIGDAYVRKSSQEIV